MTNATLPRLEKCAIYLDVILIVLLALAIFCTVAPYSKYDVEGFFGLFAVYLFLAIGPVSALAVTLNALRANSSDKSGYIERLLNIGLLLHGLGTLVVAVCSILVDGRPVFLLYTLIGTCMMGYIYAGILTLLVSRRVANLLDEKKIEE